MSALEIKWNPSVRELRQFAAIWFPALCALVGLLVFRRTGALIVPVGIWGTGIVLSVTGYLVPAFIRPVFVGLSCATYPIGWVVSHLLMAAVFYCLVTPIGTAMRLFGRVPITRRFDRSERTYWSVRSRETSVTRYFRQF